MPPETPLQNARRAAGSLLQWASVAPTVLLVGMGLGGPNASIAGLLRMFSQEESWPLAAALAGIPLAGFAIGHFVKRGFRTAYGLQALAAIGTFFIVFPFPLLGVALLLLLGRVCACEFLGPWKGIDLEQLRGRLQSHASRLQLALLAAVVLIGSAVLLFA